MTDNARIQTLVALALLAASFTLLFSVLLPLNQVGVQ